MSNISTIEFFYHTTNQKTKSRNQLITLIKYQDFMFIFPIERLNYTLVYEVLHLFGSAYAYKELETRINKLKEQLLSQTNNSRRRNLKH